MKKHKEEEPAPKVDDTLASIGSAKEAPIQTLEELQKICRAPLRCEFILQEKKVTVEVHRLTPLQTDEIEAIRREPTPPILKGRTPEENKPNYEDPAYKDACAKHGKLARAMTIYFGCPLFATEKPGLTNREHVYEFVQSKLTDLILEVIYLTISGEALRVREVNEKVNFT
jgi:hypothetical protein